MAGARAKDTASITPLRLVLWKAATRQCPSALAATIVYVWTLPGFFGAFLADVAVQEMEYGDVQESGT